MKYLLDTHALIWLLDGSSRLPLKTREIIKRNENRIYLCSISFLEIAIKVGLGKLTLSFSFEEFLDEVRERDIELLQIKEGHLKRLVALPLLHRDPFDRLLVATAMAENLTILTVDENIYKYAVPCLW